MQGMAMKAGVSVSRAALALAMVLGMCSAAISVSALISKDTSQTTSGRVDASASRPIYGLTLSSGGSSLPGCIVAIANERTGEVIVWDENHVGYEPTINDYLIYDTEFPSGFMIGDVINVTATKGIYIGWAEALFTGAEYYRIDVRLDAVMFTLSLGTGWNFVSLPMVGYDYRAGDLGTGTGSMVSRWNPMTRSYTDWISAIPNVNNFTILPNDGYWISVPAAKMLTLYGTLPTATQYRSISVPPGGGWATVGFVGHNATRRASDIPAMYSSSGSITTVSYWNASKKAYSNWLRMVPTVNDFVLVPGQAYEILCTASGVLSYEPVDPPVAAFNLVYDTTEFRGEIRTIAYTESYDPDGTILAYHWTFGDGGGSWGDRAVHVYAWPGTYTITLTVWDNDGLTDQVRKTIIISDMPAATFAHYGGSGLEVSVNASGSYTNPGATIVSYDWDFGDGGTGSGVVASHKYPFVDEPMSYYTITLTVTDSDGLKAMACKTVGAVDYHPDAGFTYCADVFTVSVDASNSWDDTGIVGYVWSWGDGTFGSNITANHTYAVPGTYAIRLTVTDEVGQTSEETRSVLVPPLPIPSFTYSVSGSTVYVDASGSSGYGGIARYTWDWGDGSAQEVATSPTASHTYGPSTPTSAKIGSTIDNVMMFTLFGYVYLSDGTTPAVGAVVTAVNLMSGYNETLTTDASGIYYSGWPENAGGAPDSGGPNEGDIINVTAVLGSMRGWNEGVASNDPGYLWLDVTLTGPGYMITLTVTDSLGRTSTTSAWVII